MLALLFDIITVTAFKATVSTVNVVNTMVNRNYDKWLSINAQQWLWADALFQCCLWHTWKVNHDKITRSIAATGSQLNAWVWTIAYNMEGQLWPQGYWLNYNQTISEDELYKLCIATHLKCLWLHNVSTLESVHLNWICFYLRLRHWC